VKRIVPVGLSSVAVIVGYGKEGRIVGSITFVACEVIGDGGLPVQAETINNMQLRMTALVSFFILFDNPGEFLFVSILY